MILRYAGRRLNDQKDDVPLEATALRQGRPDLRIQRNLRQGVSSMFPVTSVVRSWFIRVIREKSAAAFAPHSKSILDASTIICNPGGNPCPKNFHHYPMTMRLLNLSLIPQP
jgi:hypothetical protein